MKTNVDSLKGDQKGLLRIILKVQQIFKNEKHNVFTEVINKIVLSSSDDKRMQSIGLIETYAYEMSKDLTGKKGKIKRENLIKQYESV